MRRPVLLTLTLVTFVGGKGSCQTAGGSQHLKGLLTVHIAFIPALEQQNQSSASRGPSGWELLKIPLLLLNVSSLGGNAAAAALCNEWGIDDM